MMEEIPSGDFAATRDESASDAGTTASGNLISEAPAPSTAGTEAEYSTMPESSPSQSNPAEIDVEMDALVPGTSGSFSSNASGSDAFISGTTASLPLIHVAPFLIDAANSLKLASSAPFFEAEMRLTNGDFQKASLMEALVKNDKERVLHFIRNKVGLGHLDFSPLHVAVENNRDEMLEFLLKNGVDPNRKWKIYILGETPIHMAIQCSNANAVQILLENGGTPAITDSYGRTPLMMAALRSDPDVVERIFDLLLSRQTDKDVNRVDYGEKVSALNYVVRNTNLTQLKFVKHLLMHGANPNIQNKRLKRTALMEAIVFRSHDYVEELTRLFIEFGFDAHIQDTGGSTVLHLLSEWGFTEATRELLQYGRVNPNRQNHRGQTPLWLACFYNHVEIVLLLIVVGSDLSIKNHSDSIHNLLPKSPFMISVEMGHFEITRMLVQAGYNPYDELWFSFSSLPIQLALNLKMIDWLKYSTRNPRQLQHLARIAIRQVILQADSMNTLTPYRLSLLPLPPRLLAFLLFNDLPPERPRQRHYSGLHQLDLDLD